MSEWITDRRPRKLDDPDVVYAADGKAKIYFWIEEGEAWKPIPNVDPYVKPKQYRVEGTTQFGPKNYAVYANEGNLIRAFYIPTREAAERIAAIYEEVLP